MNFLIFVFIFIFGLVIGSFLNAIIYRLKVKKSVWHGRSFCPKCKKKLGFWDLIPVFSFIFLRGKCRYCHEKISYQYPLVELATGTIFFLIFYYQILAAGYLSWISIIPTIFYFFIASCLIVIFVYDLLNYIIPDKVIWPAIIISLAYASFAIILYLLKYKEIFYKLYPHTWPPVYNPWYIVYGALLGGGFFLLVVLISRGKWMGGGDIRLGTLMGLVLGFPLIFLALLIAFVSGSFVGLGLIAAKKKKFKSKIPFAPFLIFGTFIALFWGANIIEWYIHLLLR
jgi:prepilin signal peptidase PulO-like enzyme (type II secretory pathway)